MQIEETAISQEQIDAWKAEFGKIYKTTVGDVEIIWRRLKRKEYVGIMNETAELDREAAMFERQERFVKTVAIWPANVEVLVEDYAGLATQLADEIVVKSGFDFGTTDEM